MKSESRYLDGSYMSENPEWDRNDSPWKASKVFSILSKNKLQPNTICEVGCGAGDILVNLQKYLPSTNMKGYDISPQLSKFWLKHNESEGGKEIEFILGDFHVENEVIFDVLLMLDVFEHVRDPLSFLENSRQYASYFVFHIPLDLSASSVFRGYPLINVRRKVGHLHYYTKELAIETLTDAGYSIIDWQYSAAYLNAPNRSLKTRILALPRRLVNLLNEDIGVRLLGGETLFVLAKT